MKQFNVYVSPQGGYQAVKQGWSWPAFFFTWIWALVKKLWAIGFGVIFAYLVMNTAFSTVGEIKGVALSWLGSLVFLASMCIFGAKGNTWRASNIVSKGYALKGTVEASDGEEAITIGHE